MKRSDTESKGELPLLKVCHLSSVHKADDIRVFWKECRSLAEAGYDTTLIACKATKNGGNVRIIGLEEGGGRFGRIVLRTYRVFMMALDVRADIYHFHDPELLPYGILLKARTKAKVVYDSHECYREDLLNKEWIFPWIRRPLAKVFELFENFAVKRIDAVVGATPHIASRFSGVARKVVTVNNFPRVEEFADVKALPIATRDGICYVGAISFIRGVMPFLDSLDHVPRAIVVRIAGSFASKEVQLAATSHRNWERIEFHGQVDRKVIHEIYARSFGGIVNFLPAPNHSQSQPNKLFEYMAAGIPVIASDFQLWSDIIVPDNCGLTVDPNSPVAISQAINFLHENPERAVELGENARKAVSSKFCWGHEESVLFELYRSL